MDKVNIIPSGYRLTVETWEGDGDNYKTEILVGLHEKEVKLYVALCKAFNEDSEIANLLFETPESSEFINSLIFAGLDRYGFPSQRVVGTRLKMYELGLLSTLDTRFTRVCSKIVVEYIPEEIHITDVTEEFV